MKIVLSLLTNRPVSVPSHFEIIVQFKRIKTKKKKNSDIICFLKTLLSKVDNKDFGHLDLCSINIFIKTLPILGLCGTCCRLPLLTLQTGNSVVLTHWIMSFGTQEYSFLASTYIKNLVQ